MKSIYFLLPLFLVLVVFTTACGTLQTATPSQFPPQSTAVGKLDDVPIFPGATNRSDFMNGRSYTISNADLLDVVNFYKEKMKNTGWELLGVGDISMASIGDAYILWFSKDEDLLIIEVFTKENKVNVVLHFE